MSMSNQGGPPVLVQPPQPQPVPQQPAQQAGAMPQLDLTPQEMISPEQHIAGVAKFYHQFRRSEATYKMVNETLHGNRRFPILSAPTGVKMPDGSQETIEIDIHAPFLKIQDPAKQHAGLKAVLGPLNNHYAAQYTESLRELALYALNAWKALSGQNDLATIQGAAYDDLINAVHAGYAQFEPRWRVIKEVQDSLATGKISVTLGGAVGIDLNMFLAAANVPQEQHGQVLANVLGNRVTELQKELVPCLQTIAASAATAVHQIDQSNEQRARQGQTA